MPKQYENNNFPNQISLDQLRSIEITRERQEKLYSIIYNYFESFDKNAFENIYILNMSISDINEVLLKHNISSAQRSQFIISYQSLLQRKIYELTTFKYYHGARIKENQYELVLISTILMITNTLIFCLKDTFNYNNYNTFYTIIIASNTMFAVLYKRTITKFLKSNQDLIIVQDNIDKVTTMHDNSQFNKDNL